MTELHVGTIAARFMDALKESIRSTDFGDLDFVRLKQLFEDAQKEAYQAGEAEAKRKRPSVRTDYGF